MKDIILKASEFSKIFWLESMRLPANEQFRYYLYGVYYYEEIDELLE